MQILFFVLEEVEGERKIYLSWKGILVDINLLNKTKYFESI